MGAQPPNGSHFGGQSPGGRFLRLYGGSDTQETGGKQSQQLGAADYGDIRCGSSSRTGRRPCGVTSHHPTRSQHTIQRMQANTAPQTTSEASQPKRTSAALRGKTIQEQIDQLTAEVGPPTDTILPEATDDVVEVPESIPASQDTVIFSPSGRPVRDQEEPSPVEPTPNPKRKLMFTSPGSDQAPTAVDTSTQASQPSAATRPPAKRLKQSTLTCKQTPANKQASAVFDTPNQPSPWFTANYTGVHTESGIVRWFGSLKIPEKKKTEARQFIDTVLKQYPSISEEQRGSLDSHAVAQGIPVRAVAKFADAPLMRLLSIIVAMSN